MRWDANMITQNRQPLNWMVIQFFFYIFSYFATLFLYRIS